MAVGTGRGRIVGGWGKGCEEGEVIQHLTLPILLLAALLTASVQAASHDLQASNQAGVVVLFGDGTVRTACVGFTEPSLTGFELMQRAGLQLSVEIGAGSATVCKIEQEGCDFPGESCFCQCKGGGGCRYWAYWHLADGAWQFSSLGASSYRIQPGAVDGWAWGGGSVTTGAKPPVIPFDQICRVPEAATTAVEQTIVLPPANTETISAVPPVPPTTIASAMPVAITPTSPGAGGSLPNTEPGPTRGQSPANYAFFVALLTGLIVWIVVIRRRRRS